MLCKKLEELDSVKISLQKEEATVEDARTLFEAVIEKHSSTTARLRSHAAIINDHQFESSIIKLQNRHEATISTAEKSELNDLLKYPSTSEELLPRV